MSKYEGKLGPLEVGLRRDLVFTRQEMAGRPRYVAHDPISFQNHIFSATDYQVITAISRHRSLAECFARLVERGVLDEGSVDAFYEFVLALHGKQLLQLPVSQADVLFKRYQMMRAARAKGWYTNLMYWKVPLWNPDQFLDRTVRHVAWFFSRYGLMLWIALMAGVLWKCAGRIGEMFSESFGLLELSNLPVMWVALVVLKAIHELGHAYICKRLGGEVPEMGLAFIVMTPCAYVDASASWKFTSRWDRMAVALGGMFVETTVAGVFALVWAGTNPGLLHDVALNVIVLASVVTVLLNMNPLVKFDGYFVFSDLCGVFNLRERASAHVKGWVQHIALGFPRPTDRYNRWERLVYGLYAPSAFVYKILLAFAITSMVMMTWPSTGLVLGTIFGWALIARPVLQLYRYLWRAEETEAVRTRARAVALSTVAVALFVLAFLPISASVVAPGVLDPAIRVSVRAPVNGFVTEMRASHGDVVSQGQVLCVVEDPALELQRLRVLGELRTEELHLDVQELEDPTLATIHRARLEYLRARLADIDRRLQSMDLAAKVEGTLVCDDPLGWRGRYVRRGDELGQVHSRHGFLRIVLTGEDVDRALLEPGSEAVVRFTADPSRSVRAVVREIRRSASRNDVPLELTMLAGGDVYARSTETRGGEADQPYLHVFLETEAVPFGARSSGMTARVRLSARVQTLGTRVGRALLGFYHAWRMT